MLERLAELLFELSNQDRLSIIEILERGPKKLTQISKELDLTAQEASRHLARMMKANLLDKQSDGAYCITPYAKQISTQLSGIEFLSTHQFYFKGHSMSGLIPSFILRIGELTGGKMVDNAIMLFQHVDAALLSSQEFIWIMADQALSSTLPILIKKLKEGVSFRTLMPEMTQAPALPGEVIPDFQPYQGSLMENRHYNEIPLVTIITENTAIITFPDLNGNMDYTGFVCEGSSAVRWASDVFQHYWKFGSEVIIPEAE